MEKVKCPVCEQGSLKECWESERSDDRLICPDCRSEVFYSELDKQYFN